MKSLVILFILITACDSRPTVKVPPNMIDTIIGGSDTLFEVQNHPDSNSTHQFKIIAHPGSDTIIIKNKKQ